MSFLIKETDTYKLEHDLETDSILHTSKRFLVTEEWIDLLCTGRQYFCENDLSKWISDNRNLPLLHSNIDNWLYSDWLPSMVETGWKQWALVPPHMPVGKVSQKAYQKNFAKLGVEVKSFRYLQEAKEWMRN